VIVRKGEGDMLIRWLKNGRSNGGFAYAPEVRSVIVSVINRKQFQVKVKKPGLRKVCEVNPRFGYKDNVRFVGSSKSFEGHSRGFIGHYSNVPKKDLHQKGLGALGLGLVT
jgi:hypothetical protein